MARNWKEWAKEALENIPSGAGLVEATAVERILNEVVYHAETCRLHDTKVICSRK